MALEELNECNAISIEHAIKSALNKLIGVGSGNASVMVGINNGVHAIFKKDNPNLILIKYVRHSLQ